MKLIKDSLGDFFEGKKDYFIFALVLFVFLVCWLFNYAFLFVPKVTDYYKGGFGILVFYFIFYLFGMVLILPTVWLAYGRKENSWNIQNIMLLFGGSVVLVFASGARINNLALVSFASEENIRIGMLIINYVSNIAIYLALPVIWFLAKKEDPDRFLGWNHLPNIKQILFIIAMILPLVAVASFSPSFLSVYPRFTTRYPFGLDYNPPFYWILAFEIAYGFGFVALESFFRGLLVFPLASRIGSKQAVLLMSFLYGFLHFTKPMFEALGSFFGGFALGMIALRTRSVLGGIMIHVAVAWSMELFAFLQAGFK
ncbi:CPBP family intramembrane metalloprotease domain-containing protein [Leptospira perolatii]|uniref:CPBP family intramembrane metalloprotease domain-containing protein n=1 Tax=Leptospira perolatii TaxID=2023191 RepID=A0A2M9ZRI4_9LEPT|nr:CPBP family intramembrane glutamic endopeptidase [Leptospira perolatii]PJZ71139.1 CPBP family intramembrane metalloprotease domain-containing protein [Leptospira perolatii]PJZ74672.1 CPBP family intramembrane metalloprotease domain-containing protein [Leptospira perolatii]